MEDTGPRAQSRGRSLSVTTNGFGCTECSRLRKIHSEEGVLLGKPGEGAAWRCGTGIWLAEVNMDSWVLGDGTRGKRRSDWEKRPGPDRGLNAAAAAVRDFIPWVGKAISRF